MNKYFTKEYIKECDCEKIQRLRPKIKHGDWYSTSISKVFLFHNYFDITCRQVIIWLPTGDQLDDEIIKICKDKKLHYSVMYFGDEPDDYEFLYLTDVSSPASYTGKSIDIIEQNNNPLIAKIKLLKELLK